MLCRGYSRCWRDKYGVSIWPAMPTGSEVIAAVGRHRSCSGWCLNPVRRTQVVNMQRLDRTLDQRHLNKLIAHHVL